MSAPQIYIAVSLTVLAIVAVLVLFVGRNKRIDRLSPLAGLAFAFLLAALMFGEDRLIGYGLWGVGVLLALTDMFGRARKA